MTIMTSSEVTKVDTSGAGVKATVKTATVMWYWKLIFCSVPLVWGGQYRKPWARAVRRKTDKGKITVDINQQTSVPGIYAIGDCTPGQALAHVAAKEGINAAEHIAGHKVTPMDYNNIPGCTYCSPEIAPLAIPKKPLKMPDMKSKLANSHSWPVEKPVPQAQRKAL